MYRLELRPAAVKALRKIEPGMRARVQAAIDLLAADPRPPAARKLTGRDAYRVHVGSYRIIYQIQDSVLLVVVVQVGHRSDVYR